LWQVPPGTKGEFEVYVQLNAAPFAADNSNPSSITL